MRHRVSPCHMHVDAAQEGATLEQNVVGNNRSIARRIQHRANVLHEVKLLVRRRRPSTRVYSYTFAALATTWPAVIWGGFGSKEAMRCFTKSAATRLDSSSASLVS